MKKLFLISLMLGLFASFLFPQQGTLIQQDTPYGHVVASSLPISLAKATTNYSEEFDLTKWLPGDSTKPVGFCTWQSNDSITFTLTLQIKNSYVASGVTSGTWYDAASVTATAQLNTGLDTLYNRTIMQRGTVASGVSDIVTMSGKVGNKARWKVVFTTPTTLGNSGTLRTWLYLTKKY